MKIRRANQSDSDDIWRIFHAVVRRGDTYALDPQMTRDEALRLWFAAKTETFVAIDDKQQIVGTYILRPNQSGPGAHVANAAFMVALDSRRNGVGRAMAEHCLTSASAAGYRAMQFNFVVSTNTSAVKLWQQLGFETVGTLPRAFHHPTAGFVDAYVMFRELTGR